MIRGPVEYVPPVEVEVVTKRTAIPLDENEGIYVRNVKNGKVREVAGETYMLNQDEELWEKYLLPADETLLAQEKDPLADRGYFRTMEGGKEQQSQRKPRDKTRVVSFRVPHNAAVQIYDYKEKKARYHLQFVFSRAFQRHPRWGGSPRKNLRDNWSTFWVTVCKMVPLSYQTVVCPVCLSVCLSICPLLSVCNVGVLWPNGRMDQNETWHAGRTQL